MNTPNTEMVMIPVTVYGYGVATGSRHSYGVRWLCCGNGNVYRTCKANGIVLLGCSLNTAGMVWEGRAVIERYSNEEHHNTPT